MSFLKINNLSVDYKMRKETVYAAKNVNIEVNKGEILGLVGESGSGKSTVGNAIINLIDEPINISGNESEPRTGSFEVVVNGKLLFSKFKLGRFPNESEIYSWFD